MSFGSEQGRGSEETRAISTSFPGQESEYWYTYPQATGNRLLRGGFPVFETDPITFDVDGRPKWLVAHPGDVKSHWTVVRADGRASRWSVGEGDAVQEGEYRQLPPDMPPVVATSNGESTLLQLPADIAPSSPPAVAQSSSEPPLRFLYVAENGDLVVSDDGDDRFEVNALPDGRLAAIGDGRFALFGDRTDRYTHGALGDTIEGSSLVIVDPSVPEITSRTTVGPPETFEGLQPMAADIDGDGENEIVTTVADASNGARIVVFTTDGDQVATGPIHGPGWRHQLAVGPFGPDGQPELAVVRKPHVEHVLEFYRLTGGSLEVVATIRGFSTHTYGSRILDGALGADLDDDGSTELLLPSIERDHLVAVRRNSEGAMAVHKVPLGGALTTNITGVSLSDGQLAVGAGNDGEVTVWQG